jgi:hypothetical protein
MRQLCDLIGRQFFKPSVAFWRALIADVVLIRDQAEIRQDLQSASEPRIEHSRISEIRYRHAEQIVFRYEQRLGLRDSRNRARSGNRRATSEKSF